MQHFTGGNGIQWPNTALARMLSTLQDYKPELSMSSQLQKQRAWASRTVSSYPFDITKCHVQQFAYQASFGFRIQPHY
jgi:hypothetical protein